MVRWLTEYYGADAEITVKCCRRIELLCQGLGSQTNCEAAVQAGGCSAIVAALGKHSEHETAQDTGRAALRAIAGGVASFSDAALAAGSTI